VQVVVVDLRNVGVGDDNVREVLERLEAVGETNRSEGEGEVGRGQKRPFG
jgi:hypothetical protein